MWGSVWQHTTPAWRPPVRPASELADDFIENYVSWREEATTVRAAYELWLEAAEPDQPLAFAAYRAALDREEKAAGAFCESAGQLSARG